jgi:hypothetical protein
MKLPGVRVVALAGAAALALGVFAGVAPPASAAGGTPYSQAQFAALGSGSEVFLRALTSGTTTLADVEQAFAAQSVNSTGLSGNAAGKFDADTGALIQPASVTVPTKSAYGAGSGVEVGLGINNKAPTNQNQLVFPSGTSTSTRVEASSPPSPSVAGPKSLVDLSNTPLSNVLTARALEATAATNFNNNFCPLGNPIAFGEGHAADAGVLKQGLSDVVDLTTKNRGVAQSRTFSYLSPNSDGTFGMTSQTQQTIVPATINLGPLAISIAVQGGTDSSGPVPIGLKAVAPGEAGQKGGVTLTNNGTVSINITNNGAAVPNFPLNLPVLQSLPPQLKNITIPGLATIKIDDLETLAGSNGTTRAGATYDLVRVTLAGKQLADVAIGHMQSVATAETPINCNIPVSKTADPPVVTAGNTFTWNINIPSSADALKDSTCDLEDISAVDTISTQSGNPKFTFVSASNGGVYDSVHQTVTWSNLGTYHIGSPPIMLQIKISVPADSPEGVFKDDVDVKAKLSCKGNAEGITGIDTGLNGIGVTGHVELNAPQVMAIKQLPRTGGGGPILPWVGGGLLLAAGAALELIRRVRRSPTTV